MLLTFLCLQLNFGSNWVINLDKKYDYCIDPYFTLELEKNNKYKLLLNCNVSNTLNEYISSDALGMSLNNETTQDLLPIVICALILSFVSFVMIVLHLLGKLCEDKLKNEEEDMPELIYRH
jgi:hypothetical protein